MMATAFARLAQDERLQDIPMSAQSDVVEDAVTKAVRKVADTIARNGGSVSANGRTVKVPAKKPRAKR